jgi:hypothetical protein
MQFMRERRNEDRYRVKEIVSVHEREREREKMDWNLEIDAELEIWEKRNGEDAQTR